MAKEAQMQNDSNRGVASTNQVMNNKRSLLITTNEKREDEEINYKKNDNNIDNDDLTMMNLNNSSSSSSNIDSKSSTSSSSISCSSCSRCSVSCISITSSCCSSRISEKNGNSNDDDNNGDDNKNSNIHNDDIVIEKSNDEHVVTFEKTIKIYYDDWSEDDQKCATAGMYDCYSLSMSSSSPRYCCCYCCCCWYTAEDIRIMKKDTKKSKHNLKQSKKRKRIKLFDDVNDTVFGLNDLRTKKKDSKNTIEAVMIEQTKQRQQYQKNQEQQRTDASYKIGEDTNGNDGSTGTNTTDDVTIAIANAYSNNGNTNQCQENAYETGIATYLSVYHDEKNKYSIDNFRIGMNKLSVNMRDYMVVTQKRIRRKSTVIQNVTQDKVKKNTSLYHRRSIGFFRFFNGDPDDTDTAHSAASRTVDSDM